ncbi:hypothetical protein K501DRAFT_309360 [Backusella circina FSU 941]|nr:hypothetical protein K501DRAFT_309360 [Backusella circina FSU 941]
MFARKSSLRLNNIPSDINKRLSAAVTRDYPTRPGFIVHQSPLFQQQQRIFSKWAIPKLFLSSNKNTRRLMLATAGGVTLLGSFFGPVAWMTVGGVASIITWRTFKKNSNKWWEYLNNPPSGGGLATTILTQVGAHRAAECVRQTAIDQLKKYKSTEAGQKLFSDFGLLDHEKELVYEDIHKSESLRLDNDKHKVSVVFWLEDQVSTTPKGGSCEVNAEAVIDNKGKIDLTQIKLSSPEWHKDELVPIF